jgi:hypothetical protein
MSRLPPVQPGEVPKHTAMVQSRHRTVINTDPQRRCYDGCNFSEEVVWTGWADLCPFRLKEDAEESAASWRKINPKHEYRVVSL